MAAFYFRDADRHVLKDRFRGGEQFGRIVIDKVRIDFPGIGLAVHEAELQVFMSDQKGHGAHPDRIDPLGVIFKRLSNISCASIASRKRRLV